MRRFIIAVSVLVVAASSSNCSDTTAANVAAVPSVVPPGGAAPFVNSGSAQGDEKETPGTGSSISRLVVAVITDTNADGRPDRGDSVTFNIATTQPWNQVSLVCSQSGQVVLRDARTPNAWSPITLTSPLWQSGPADCIATLDQFNGTKLMTLAFVSFAAGA